MVTKRMPEVSICFCNKQPNESHSLPLFILGNGQFGVHYLRITRSARIEETSKIKGHNQMILNTDLE